MASQSSAFLKMLEEIYLTTPTDEVRDFIDAKLIETISQVVDGRVLVVTSK